MPRRLCIALIGAILGATACDGGSDNTTATSDATPATSSTSGGTSNCDVNARLDVAYLDAEGWDQDLTSLDAYPVPGVCAAPVVVWVHGGGWRAGDKRNSIQQKRAWLLEQGAALVSANYRLTDPDAAEPVMYPTHNEDVAAAVSYVVDHAAELGIDPDRIVLMGHSAGAAIVASIGVDERYLGAHDLGLEALRCVAVDDTVAIDLTRIVGLDPLEPESVYTDAFGTDRDVLADASPINHIAPDKGIPSTLIVTRGTRARVRLNEDYADALRDAGVDVTLVRASGYTHADVNVRIGDPDDEVLTPALESFFGDCWAD